MFLTRAFLKIIMVAMLISTTNLFAQFETGKTYNGFKLIEKEFVKEVNAECYYFEHIKSGAKLFKIASDDDNKTFSIAFKTIPESDCGTPHIMEHSVLNGSKNFPVKSPFDILAKGSLNTFLNAMTGSDMTIYPVASMNDKDYFNLMHVYLDAVFYPLIYDDPRILMQEGWHHELTGKDEPVVYKGVVYNEMKGAFSGPTRELDYQITKNLFPDNGYQYSSGGYPSAIPQLTYNDFINFHKKYYHPSNSYIFLYGNADLNKELEFIDSKYLSNFDKSDQKVSIPLQKPFEKMKEVKAYYPVTEGSSTENQTYLNYSFVVGLNTNKALEMGLDVLCDVLVNQESAPIRLALQEAGIGKEVYAYADNLKQNVVEIVVQNANPSDKDKFYEIVKKEFEKAVKNGLDKEAVEGTFNRKEFGLREGNDAQKGLRYNFQLMSGWFFADNPFMGLEYEKPLAEIKSSLEKGYLENLISKYFIDNPHSVLVVLEPKPGLEGENNLKTEKELKEYKSSLSKEQLDKLVSQTNELMEYQKREDTPEQVSTIPLLELKDINSEAEWYSIKEEKVEDVPVLYHEEFTNDVVYAKLYFDLKVLPQELIPYSSLLSEILGDLNTKNYSYGDLDKALNIHTGGFNTSLNSFLEEQNDSKMENKFVVSSKAMNVKVDKMFELLGEIVNNSTINDKDRLKNLLTRHQARLDAQIKQNGFGYARTRLTSYISNEGMFDEITGGIDYYNFITNLAKNFDAKSDEIINNLTKTAELLFNKNNMIASVTCFNSDLNTFNNGLDNFIKSLPVKDVDYQHWEFKPEKKNEGLQAASKVQYVIKGFDFKKLGYDWNGKMLVLNQILSREWLQNQIRVLGGAYGGFSSFSRSGVALFASYRDPNLRETLENYDKTPEYLKTFEADDQEMTRFIIGTIAGLDRPLRPSQKGDAAVRRYLERTTKEEVQKNRDAVLKTTPEDIKQMTKLVADILAQQTYCVYGNEEKINTEKDLFKNIVKLGD